MTSIIKFFRKSNLNFSISSSPPYKAYNGYNALSKSGQYFESATSPYFWEINFAKPVAIESYILSGNLGWVCYIKSWEISYSVNGSSYISLQIDSMDDTRGNKEKFKLNPPIYCKYFRITMKTSVGSTLVFNGFDCFGLVPFMQKQYTCNIAFAKRTLIKHQMIALMIISHISS